MVAYVKGDVVSFRITDEFTENQLEHLKKAQGSKSRTMAKYCARGIAVEMESKIVICAKELPVQTREWLSNPDNMYLLVSTLQSLHRKDNRGISEWSSEPSEAEQHLNLDVVTKVTREPLEIRLDADLNDFLKQLI